MADDMSDENDDLDAFARFFGATPQIPPEGSRPPAGAAAGGDPLGWLLSDSLPPALMPGESAYAPTTTAGFPATPAVAETPQVLPTRRSLAAEAARASREAGRRTLIILGGIGGVILVLIVVLVAVLAAKNGSSGSPAALEKRDASTSPSANSTTSSPATPTVSAAPTPTPTPTPLASQPHAGSAAAPSAPTVSATVSGQPDCTSGSPTRISIGYTTTNATTLNLASSDGSVNTNLAAAASGTIPSVRYQCGGSG